MTRSASARVRDAGWLASAVALGTILVVTAYRLFAVRDALFPGHADRAFYFDVAQHMADGKGPNIDYVWQYLAPQDHLTHYAFDYWMPLPSILMAAPLWLVGGGLPTALSVSAVLAAVFALATWWTTAALTTRRWIPPVSAIVIVLLPSVTTFGVQSEASIAFCAFGALAFACTLHARQRRSLWFVAGIFAACAHLSRGEGLLVAGTVALCAVAWSREQWRPAALLRVAAGYLLLIVPYVVVNIEKFGSFYPPATRSFPFATSAGAIYGLRNPTLSDMLGLGVRGNIDLRLIALADRSAELVGQNGAFVMVAVLLLTGVALGTTSLPSWRVLWRSQWLLPCTFGAGFAALHVVATPAISASGAFIKSSPLLVSLLLPVALIGLDRLTRRRSWRAVMIAVLLVPPAYSLAPATRQVLAEDALVGAEQRALLPRLDRDQDCVTGDIVVMTRTPWQFTLATGIPSVQIPDASRADILREAERWGVTHIVGNRFMKELRELFASGGEDAVLEGLSSNLWRLQSPRTDHCIAPNRADRS